MPYVKALNAATNRALLLDSEKPKKIDGPSAEQMLRMESEIEGLQKDLKLIEESYGTEMLNLVLARAYVLSPSGAILRQARHAPPDARRAV